MSNLDLKAQAEVLGKNAREASRALRTLSKDVRSAVLKCVATKIRAAKEDILAANQKDLEDNREHLAASMLDRLTLNEARIEAMAKGADEIADFEDPLFKTLEKRTLKNNIEISRVSVPLGSIFFIYESRPNVTIDGASLCFKSGNAVLLRGGKESLNSSKILAQIFRSALEEFSINPNAVQLVENPDHALVAALLQLNNYFDLVIPRGGERLIHAVVEQSKIPVIKHFNGICHVYIDKSADLEKASAILVNAKTQRTGVCNAMECVLFDRNLEHSAIQKLVRQLQECGVEFYGDKECVENFEGVLDIGEPSNYHHEYLALKASIKLVDNVQDACAHIEKYSSGHTEAIVAEDEFALNYFALNVDSSSVMLNASTRFADGGEYGLGAEVGISTDKIHARGPMGVESLCTYKWILKGAGHIRP